MTDEGMKSGRETTAAEDRYRAPALDKGLDILELLSDEPGGLTRAEIVKAMGRSPGEIYRMLERLVARDYVVRSPEGDRYALSMKLFSLAHRHPPLRRLVAPAQPLMDRFARETRQSCHLVALDHTGAIVVAQASCPGNWEFGLRIGASIDLTGTGSGQLLMALLGPDERARCLSLACRSPDALAAQGFERHLEAWDRQGFRRGDSHELRGVEDLSVAVRAFGGGTLAVLTCPYVQRLDGAHLSADTILARLLAVAEQLSGARSAKG